jgi:hypothetical protein
MHIILKPAGAAILAAGIAGLAALSLVALRRGGAKTTTVIAAAAAAPPPPPPVTRVMIGGLKEAEVEDLIGGDFARHPGPFRHRAEGSSGGKAEGTLSSALSFNCWDNGATAEAKLVEDPERPGAKLLEVRNLSGQPSAQVYTWKKHPVNAHAKYILACEYKTESNGVLNLDNVGFAPRRVDLSATGGKWKTVQTAVDREKAGEMGVALQYFGSGEDKPLRVRSLHLWRVK